MVAHVGGIPPPFSPVRLLNGWSFSPLPLVLVVAAGVLYALGLRRLSSGPRFPSGRVVAFYGGLAATLVAVASPVDTYANVSFSDHMVQHILLMFVAAPLFALGTPVTLALRAARSSTRKRWILPVLHSVPVRVLSHPLVAMGMFTVVQYVTHLTSLYNLALRSNPVHDLEHALYLGTALLFWWPVVGLDPAPHRMSHPARLLYLVAAMPLEAFLAVALLSASPYPHYLALPPPWGGAAAVADQSAAAAFMWIAGDLSTLIAALLVAAAWFRHDEARQRRIEADIDRLAATRG
jgi:cytochrome c oxidase assembly factor CtaG